MVQRDPKTGRKIRNWKLKKKVPEHVQVPLGIRKNGYMISEEEIREAYIGAKSIREASTKLNIDQRTFAKYAKMYIDPETGKTLHELYKNKGRKGGKKPHKGQRHYQRQIDGFLQVQRWVNPRRIALLRAMLIKYDLSKDHCEICGYNRKRLKDDKLPLILHFVDGNKKNWVLDNIKFLCYNCYFQNINDPFTSRIIGNIESKNITEGFEEENKLFFQLDDYYLKELEKLGKFAEDGRYKNVSDLIDFKEEDIEDIEELEDFKKLEDLYKQDRKFETIDDFIDYSVSD